ncbi:trans-sialidase, partial [Trypanosoma rangeli]
VGFLSNALTDGTDAGKVWKDEYLGVNATVKGETVTSTEWGLRFKGAAAGAEWPVGSKGQNQPYYFANNEFTLVATVAIHAVPEEDTPLMGARMNDTDGTALFDLSYTREKKWKFQIANTKTGQDADYFELELNKTYQVLVEMNINEWYVYINGANIYDSDDDEEGTVSTNVEALFRSHRISHFYFGGGSAAEGTATSHDVTVSNVLLYNEALGGKEIRELNASTVALPQPAAERPDPKGEASPGTTDGDAEKPDSESQSKDELDWEKPSDADQDAADTNDGGDDSQAPENSSSVPAPRPPTTEQSQPQEPGKPSAAQDEETLPSSNEEDEVNDDKVDGGVGLPPEGGVSERVVGEKEEEEAEVEEEEEGPRGGAELGPLPPSSSKVSADADGHGDGKADAAENVPFAARARREPCA